MLWWAIFYTVYKCKQKVHPFEVHILKRLTTNKYKNSDDRKKKLGNLLSMQYKTIGEANLATSIKDTHNINGYLYLIK